MAILKNKSLQSKVRNNNDPFENFLAHFNTFIAEFSYYINNKGNKRNGFEWLKGETVE